jgi:hypothetical protein
LKSAETALEELKYFKFAGKEGKRLREKLCRMTSLVEDVKADMRSKLEEHNA